jgi:hypothetical protein
VLLSLLWPVAAQRGTIDWQPAQDLKNRYEGFIERPIASPIGVTIDIVSFTSHRDVFDRDATLFVRFFLPRGTVPTVTARELRERRFYRMQSKPWSFRPGEWDMFGPWPSAAVLDGNVPAGNLGVVVNLDGGAYNLAPAQLSASATTAAQVTAYRLMLRPNRGSLSKVVYEVDTIAGTTLSKRDSRTLEGEKPIGEPFPIDVDAEGLPAGHVRLFITGYVKNSSEMAKAQIDFEHQPVANGR